MAMINKIRISCAALCCIKINGRFLLEINKNRGDILTPIGGALEFHESARAFLQNLGAIFENESDLRLILPEDNLPIFSSWFEQAIDRETNPFRELQEELVIEHHCIDKISNNDIVMNKLGLWHNKATTSRKQQQGEITEYFIEYYDIQFLNRVIMQKLRTGVTKSERLFLVSPEELYRGQLAISNIKLSVTAQALLNYEEIE